MGITQQLCEVIAAQRFERLPAEAIAAARRVILDGVAVAVAGTTEAAPRIVAEHVRSQGGAERRRAAGREAVREGSKTMSDVRDRASGRDGPSRADLVEEAIVLGIIVLVVGAYEWDVRDIARPELNLMVMRPVLVVTWALIAAVLVRYLAVPLAARARGGGEAPPDGAAASGRPGALRGGAPMLLVAGALLAYAAAFTSLPFVLTTAVFMAVTLYGLGNRNVLAVVVLSAGTATGLYLVGAYVLGVSLP